MLKLGGFWCLNFWSSSGSEAISLSLNFSSDSEELQNFEYQKPPNFNMKHKIQFLSKSRDFNGV